MEQQYDIPPIPGQEQQIPQEDKSETNLATSIVKFFYELIKIAIIVFILQWVIRAYLIQPFLVSGDSMEPNFHDGEYIFVEKASARLGGYKRGDVVVFKAPKNVDDNYIKRIIGLPNEKIDINDGKIIITNQQFPKGQKLDESYISNQNITEEIIRELGPNEYFVLGDNRPNSSDSREWGSLPHDKIIGKAWLTLYPFSDFGFVKKTTFNITEIFLNSYPLVFNDS